MILTLITLLTVFAIIHIVCYFRDKKRDKQYKENLAKIKLMDELDKIQKEIVVDYYKSHRKEFVELLDSLSDHDRYYVLDRYTIYKNGTCYFKTFKHKN